MGNLEHRFYSPQDVTTVFRRQHLRYFGAPLAKGDKGAFDSAVINFGFMPVSQKNNVARDFVNAALDYFSACGSDVLEGIGKRTKKAIGDEAMYVTFNDMVVVPSFVTATGGYESHSLNAYTHMLLIPGPFIIFADQDPVVSLAAMASPLTTFNALSPFETNFRKAASEIPKIDMQVEFFRHLQITNPGIVLPEGADEVLRSSKAA